MGAILCGHACPWTPSSTPWAAGVPSSGKHKLEETCLTSEAVSGEGVRRGWGSWATFCPRGSPTGAWDTFWRRGEQGGRRGSGEMVVSGAARASPHQVEGRALGTGVQRWVPALPLPEKRALIPQGQVELSNSIRRDWRKLLETQSCFLIPAPFLAPSTGPGWCPALLSGPAGPVPRQPTVDPSATGHRSPLLSGLLFSCLMGNSPISLGLGPEGVGRKPPKMQSIVELKAQVGGGQDKGGGR